MDEFQFYATPAELRDLALAKFKRPLKSLLEPNAGRGDLLPSDYDLYRINVDVCEIDGRHHEHLLKRGVRIVGTDFLQFSTKKRYSHILMNPPFRNGVEHVLHAWNILHDGELVAILNAQTIKNPFTQQRKFLVKLIEEFGSVEFVEGAFGEDALRKADVEVAIVHLEKRTTSGFNWSFLKRSAEKRQEFAAVPGSEVALPNGALDDIVVAYDAAVESMVAAVQAECTAGFYAELVGAESVGSIIEKVTTEDGESITQSAVKPEDINQIINERMDELTASAWRQVFNKTKLTSAFTNEMNNEVYEQAEGFSTLAFTRENIAMVLDSIAASMGDIQTEMVCRTFDYITRFHTDNAFYYKGWKSNDKHRIGMKIKPRRFILPHILENDFGPGFVWEAQSKLLDIEKTFALLDGDAINGNWVSEMERLLQRDTELFRALVRGERIKTAYFDLRGYFGTGTLHFFPNRPDLIDRMNTIVGKARQWLPESFEEAPSAFWKHYEGAEKFTSAMKKTKGWRSFVNGMRDYPESFLDEHLDRLGMNWEKTRQLEHDAA